MTSAGESARTRAAATIWVNGQLITSEDCQVSARDRGFTLADGLFETMRVSHGRVFRLDRHLARLERGLAVLQIPIEPGIQEWVLRAVEHERIPDAVVRLTVTRGIGAAGLALPPGLRPTVVVAVGPLPLFPTAIYESGLTAHVASGRRNERAMTAGLKTLAYVDAVAALLEAQRAGADDAILLDTEEHCSEAAASNLFMWTGADLVTPPISCGALPGLTRAAVLELAAGLRMTTVERPFGRDELLRAEEAFLTSSLRGVAPLVRVDGRSIGEGRPGSVTRRLMDAYASLVERECGG
jgi:branched-chain amino acid aminotransferase